MDFEIDNYNALRYALRKMCEAFEDDMSDEALFDCKLVANELLSNVLQHGGQRAYFRATLAGDEVTISVRSEHAYRPPVTSVCADTMQECGRGLFLIDTLCVRREYSDREGISVVIKIEK